MPVWQASRLYSRKKNGKNHLDVAWRSGAVRIGNGYHGVFYILRRATLYAGERLARSLELFYRFVVSPLGVLVDVQLYSWSAFVGGQRNVAALVSLNLLPSSALPCTTFSRSIWATP